MPAVNGPVLVTGGAGFIGSNLAAALRNRGVEVRVLDDLSSGHRRNLNGLDVDVRQGDIRDPEVTRAAMEGCDAVFHLAAVASVTRSIDDPVRTNDVNVAGTLNVLMQARDAGVRRVVFAGSSAVYGDSETLPKVETMPPRPLSPYALQKLAGEAYGQLFSRLYGLEVVTVRFFNVFGPRQDPNGEYAAVIPKFVAWMLAGRAPTIFGDGTQTRDFCFVDNAVSGCLLAAMAEAAPGNVYNIATGCRISLLDLVARLNEILGTDLEPVLGTVRAGDILHSFADVRAAGADLGYVPPVSFADGLARTVAWYREHGE